MKEFFCSRALFTGSLLLLASSLCWAQECPPDDFRVEYYGEPRFIVSSGTNTVWAHQIETSPDSNSHFKGNVTVSGSLSVQGTDVMKLLASMQAQFAASQSQLQAEVNVLRGLMASIVANCSCAAGIVIPPPPPPPVTTGPPSVGAPTTAASPPTATSSRASTGAAAIPGSTAAPSGTASSSTSASPPPSTTQLAGANPTTADLPASTGPVMSSAGLTTGPAASSSSLTTGPADSTTAVVGVVSTAAPLPTTTARLLSTTFSGLIVRTVPAAPYAAGWNANGQLGRTLGFDSPVPVAVTRSWTNLTSVVDVACNDQFTLYLTENGTAYSVGQNTNGQGGDGSLLNNWTPIPVVRPWAATERVTVIGTGRYSSFFALTNGRVYATGLNDNGQLGDNTVVRKQSPVLITQPWGFAVKVVQIRGGWSHTLFLLDNGLVYATGYNGYGQLGDGTLVQRTTPVQAGPTNPPWGNAPIKMVAADFYQSVVLSSSGIAYGVGYNGNGQLGDGSCTDRANFVTVRQTWGQIAIDSVSCGYLHCLYLLVDGTVWSTGYNANGQLGDGTLIQRNSSVPMLRPWGTDVFVTSVTAGFYHSVMLLNNGTVFAVGNNAYGGLGDGTTTQRSTPVRVSDPSTQGTSPIALKISAGIYHTAILYDNVYRDTSGPEFSYPVSMTTGVPFPSSGPRLVYATGYGLQGPIGDSFAVDRTTLQPVVRPWGTAAAVDDFSGGQYHSIYLAGGLPYATGSNSEGQQGDNTLQNNFSPKPVVRTWGGGSPVVNVYAGRAQSFFVLANGTIWATGSNTNGQLGDNTVASKQTPVQVILQWSPAAVKPVQIASGGTHTVFLLDNGRVYGTGYNGYGQIGDGTTVDKKIPTPAFQAWGNAFVTQVAAGYYHTLALTDNGLVYAVGYNGYAQLGDTTATDRTTWIVTKIPWGSVPVSSIAAGYYHSMFVVAGKVWGCGMNSNGQLADGSTTQRPTPVLGNSPWSGNVTSVQAGYGHTIYLTSNGQVFASGQNANGQLGDGTTTVRTSPVLVPAPFSAARAVAVTAGMYHSMVLYDAFAPPTISTGIAATTAAAPRPPTPVPRSAYTVGYNSVGQLGDGYGFTRYQLAAVRPAWPASTGIMGVSANNDQISFVTDDGIAYHTGANGNGQAGDGTLLNNWAPVPVVRPWGSVKVVFAVSGRYHTHYVLENGKVYATGYNSDGQLGDGTAVQKQSPVAITQPWGTAIKVIQIASGWYHTVFVLADGTAYACGANSYGQLGDGTTVAKTTPVRIASTSPPWGNAPVLMAAINFYQTIILSTNGLVYGVGNNGNGQLGDGSTTDRTNFVTVSRPWGNIVVNSVSAGYLHCLFLLETGDVWAVGYNANGQLGDGTTLQRNSSVAVTRTWPAGVKVSQIAAGFYHSVFLLENGRVYAVGTNSYGNLGDGTTTGRLLAVECLPPSVEGITPFALSINAGQYHTVLTYDTVFVPGSTTASVALPSSTTGLQPSNSLQTAYAFGYNFDGELGDGSAVHRPAQGIVRRTWGNTTAVVSTAAGQYHSVFVTETGIPYATGANSDGQLGDGTSRSNYMPIPVTRTWGSTAVVLVGAGRASSFFVLATGTVYGAGINTNGQLGDNTVVSKTTPVLLAVPWNTNINKVVSIAGGGMHTVFLLDNGLGYGTGYNGVCAQQFIWGTASWEYQIL
eukprot:TRINITY_DN1325_c0_g1_i5.p1 TRINITY_DN1325_c0_g1~~TRINITY_DN1325_c0_g1_i5.p1  ORF type:complete len:1691 (+),score=144.72 TRINITY_DN1325_c0_g1_i5:62-5074(+)